MYIYSNLLYTCILAGTCWLLKGSKVTLCKCIDNPLNVLENNYMHYFQEEILDILTTKQLSLTEMKEAACKYKKLHVIRRTFCRYTNTQKGQTVQNRQIVV